MALRPLLGGLRGRRRPVATVGAAVTVPAVLATLAIVYPGVPVSQVDLNDGAVWLTNSSVQTLGRFNPAVDELNAGLVASGADFDVLQDAGDVLLTEPGRLSAVDPAHVALTSQVSVPIGMQVGLASGTVAVTDPADGRVWARTTSTLGSLSVDGDEPDLDLGPGGTAVVSRSGLLLGAGPQGELFRGEVTDTGVEVVADGSLADPPSGPPGQVTAVGDSIAVLVGSTLHTSAASTDLSRYGGDLVLQQVGPRAASVLVATPSALLEVPLGGGEVREHPTGGTGVPAAPVRVGPCAHGAWATAVGSYLQLCEEGPARVKDLEGMSTQDRLVFRVNRQVVVLNDTLRGRLWVPLEDARLREPNWTDVEPDEETPEEEQESQTRQSAQNLLTECTAQSASPVASDDDLGVRPGRTTILPVIDNDGSSDCGILVISEHDPLPAEFGVLQPVHGGRALQVVTAPDASGTAEFTYTVTDGRGTSAPATATVRLTVHPDGENRAPVQLRVGSMMVEEGALAVHDVLPDFHDPDGDDLVLVSAVSDGGATVRTRQDGELTVEAELGVLGSQQVRVVVSDGFESVEGLVVVEVRPAGSLAPVIDPVHTVTYVDMPVIVRPLDHVRSLSREPVRLAGVDDVQGATVEPDLQRGRFTFTAPRAGTYYVTFLVAASPQQSVGLARIDVLEQPEVPQPPVAVRDRALLPPGGEVTIEPLANDVDPAGGILVLQSVDVPAESGLRIAVLHHELVRITSTRVLDQPVTASYTISNGSAQAVGEILVQPIPASAGQQAPVVPNVRATVRTGGIVTIPVLDRAYDPDGDRLTLVPELAEPLGPGQGLLFVSGDVLRYQAPADPREVHATFSVTDPAGNVTSAQLTVTVHASDPATKQPPRPRSLTARVFEGETIRIPVPLTGIDGDGDGVVLLGQDRAPTKGRITGVGADWLEYQALPGELGTDTFTYAVEDWVGQRAVATVRVGIASRPTASAQVVSRHDDVTVRPGQSVEVRVLANDVDTAGGELFLDPVLEMDPGIDARVEGRRIVVRAPDGPAVLQIAYTATNARGGSDSAVLTVTVTDDAPFAWPVARDVVVAATETVNRTSVEVDVLGVAQNPSGPLSDLEVSVDESVASVATVTERGTVVIALVDQAQTLPYRLTNTHPQAGRLSSYAFITVPALGDFPPIHRPGAPDLRIVAGDELTISLDEHVQVAPGRAARIVDVGSVQATKSDGSRLVLDDRTLLYRSQRSYAGPASISFTVSDGAQGDPTARTRTLTLPITVLAAEDYPPVFSPSVIDVAPGESPARVDLRVFTAAAAGTATGAERLTYRLTSTPQSGFQVTLDGSMLTVGAGAAVPRGTVGGVQLEVGYGASGTMTAQVDFRVVASSRPLARVNDVTVPGVEGGTSTVAVLDSAFNPFPGQPLTVVSATVETPGAGTAGVAGGSVQVRPAAGFIGQMVTRFRVRDVTGAADREVEARVTVVVRGRPATPVAPRTVEVRDRTVVLAWDAPVNNGEPITGYRVTAQPGGVLHECASTTCTIENLTNDVEHRFTVMARNAVGWSDPSPLSAPARPDAVPGTPSAPSLAFGDGRIDASWTAPPSTGSPITGYTVEISPSNLQGQSTFTTSSTVVSLGDLSNGTAYAVRVRAQNRAPEPGAWSGWSEMVPARAPDAPTVTAQRIQNELGGQIEVRWTPGGSGGDRIAHYDLVISGGVGARTVSGLTDTVYIFGDAANAVPYRFEVRASNKAGAGSAGVARASTFGVPTAPTITSAQATPGSGTVTLAWSAADGNGAPVLGYAVRAEPGGRVYEAGSNLGFTVPELTPGTAYTFEVRAVNEAGSSRWSAPTGERTPTVPPGTVTITAVDAVRPEPSGRPTHLSISWAAPQTTGGGTGFEYRYTVTAGGTTLAEDVSTSALGATVSLGTSIARSGTEVGVTVQAVTSAGRGVAATVTRTLSWSEPPGPVTALALRVDSTTGSPLATASWSPPGDDGGTAITGYLVRWDTGSGWSDPVSTSQRAATLPLDGVAPGTEVQVEVRAVNGRGESTVVQASTTLPADNG
ncbi:fibronectin type III domain-containing protein [Actinotalea sp. K2]|uniref:fibronectin type III domain-containing protein n=1 Tax=Actinotalea sp. K2 TaxID=2939438 RepID=UPI0020176B52|nr:fibronectin type III domain-containing protein [Actinotalea sp. K2]MCL3863203.1 fibronectin type III domain-containing protein [Actinotalea sp. K2]